MGVCVSKGKLVEGRSNGNRSGDGRHSQESQIIYTKSPGPGSQVPFKPPVSPRRVHRSDTILGKPYEDVKAYYTLGRVLGRGQSGVTYLCTDNGTSLQYACKSISKEKLNSKSDKEAMRREVQIMQHLSGQANVVEFKGAYEDKQSIHLVMELCEGGLLFDRIIAKGHYSERAAASVCRAIVIVVHMCHLMGVMHRDLKPENFLFSDDSEDALLKTIDFGVSAFINEGITLFVRFELPEF